MEKLPEPHPLAIEHLPSFITAPGQSDGLLNFVIVFLIIAVILTGVFYLKLHSLPERMMHGAHPAQFQIVAVLGLISLLTHNQVFWIAGLLLAMIDVPSLLTPLTSMSRSLHRMSIAPARRGRRASAPQAEVAGEAEELSAEAGPVEGGRG